MGTVTSLPLIWRWMLRSACWMTRAAGCPCCLCSRNCRCCCPIYGSFDYLASRMACALGWTAARSVQSSWGLRRPPRRCYLQSLSYRCLNCARSSRAGSPSTTCWSCSDRFVRRWSDRRRRPSRQAAREVFWCGSRGFSSLPLASEVSAQHNEHRQPASERGGKQNWWKTFSMESRTACDVIKFSSLVMAEKNQNPKSACTSLSRFNDGRCSWQAINWFRETLRSQTVNFMDV